MASHSRLAMIELAEMSWCVCMGMEYTGSAVWGQFKKGLEYILHRMTSALVS